MSIPGFHWLHRVCNLLRSLCPKRQPAERSLLPTAGAIVRSSTPRRLGVRFASGPLLEDEVGDDISPHLWLIELDPAFEQALVAAWDFHQLVPLFPRFLDQYTSHILLRTAHPDWCPRARLVRAFRAGVLARQFLLGDRTGPGASPVLPWPDRVFVVLRSRVPPGSWITFVRPDYLDALRILWPCTTGSRVSLKVKHI